MILLSLYTFLLLVLFIGQATAHFSWSSIRSFVTDSYLDESHRHKHLMSD